jgi:WD40 repeat protein
VQVEIVGKRGVIKVLDLDTGSEVQRLPSGEYSIRLKGNRNDVQLTQDGFTLKRGQTAVITARRVERAPSPTNNEAGPGAIDGPLIELVRFEGHESYALKLDFSPDGWRLVTACGQPDCRVLLWDARNGRLQREYKSGERSLHTVAISPDGKYVASGGKSGEIILLDAKELKEVRRWQAHEGFIDCLAFAPDSRRLASGSDNWRVAEEPATSEYNEANRETSELNKLLEAPIAELELSVRARNCLDSANLRTLRDLVTMSENEVMNLKNLGKTSLTEIKNKLTERGLGLGMET